jgi:hypothetical protein
MHTFIFVFSTLLAVTESLVLCMSMSELLIHYWHAEGFLTCKADVGNLHTYVSMLFLLLFGFQRSDVLYCVKLYLLL